MKDWKIIERLLTVQIWLSSASRKVSLKLTSKMVARSKNVYMEFLLHFLKHSRTEIKNNVLVSNPFCLLMTTPISAFHELVKRKTALLWILDPVTNAMWKNISAAKCSGNVRTSMNVLSGIFLLRILKKRKYLWCYLSQFT